MSMIKAGYLQKKGGQWRPVRLLDLVVLLYHVHLGARTSQVGFEDARETLNTLTAKLNKQIPVDPNLLESALWSCNLLNERGEFWHPKDATFDEFVLRVLGTSDTFDRMYNTIEKKV